MGDNEAGLQDALVLYERIAGTGSRDPIVLDRLTLRPSAVVNRLVARLRRLGLVRVIGGSLDLPPIASDAVIPGLDASAVARLRAIQAYWQDWSPPDGDDAGALHGIRGLWWHWWTIISTWPHAEPLPVVAVMPSGARYLRSSWLEHLDRGMSAEFLGTGWIQLRLIVPAAVRGTPNEEAVELLRAHGTRVRTLDAPSWYAVYGGRHTVAPDRPDDEFDGLSRRGEDPLAARALGELFERQWDAAAEWAPTRGADGTRVLRLLAEGLHDHEIAVRLGTSERTVRRHVADLMQQVGARTRYQLAGRAGLE